MDRIYLAVPHKMAPENWITFMTKVKEVKEVSRGEVDLFKYIKATYNYLLDKNLIVDYLKVLVKDPISKFD